MTSVDLEDTGEVLDAIMDRLLEVQVDEELPVYVIPIRPVDFGGASEASIRASG